MHNKGTGNGIWSNITKSYFGPKNRIHNAHKVILIASQKAWNFPKIKRGKQFP